MSSTSQTTDWKWIGSSFFWLVKFQDNKKDIALLLSNYLIEHSPADKIVVVAGEFVATTTFKSSDPPQDLWRLEAYHKEADTSPILHCIHALMESMVVSVRDTDVLDIS